MVIRVSTGVEQGDDDVQELSGEQQHGGQAQRRAIARMSTSIEEALTRSHRRSLASPSNSRAGGD